MYVRKTDGLYSSCLRSSPLSPILSDSPLSARIYLASCMRQLYVAQVFGQIILSFVACICTRNRFVDGRRSAYPRGRHRGRGTGRLKVEGCATFDRLRTRGRGSWRCWGNGAPPETVEPDSLT
jgi:hypothetical protein